MFPDSNKLNLSMDSKTASAPASLRSPLEPSPGRVGRGTLVLLPASILYMKSLPDFRKNGCLPPCSQVTNTTGRGCGNALEDWNSIQSSRRDLWNTDRAWTGRGGVRLRDRVFYPTLLTVIATYYILFAVMGSSTLALVLESLIAGALFALAVAGFKKNLWLIVVALAGHGVFDFIHHRIPVTRCGGPALASRSTFSQAVSSPFC